jgi:RHS repeat-associated protein
VQIERKSKIAEGGHERAHLLLGGAVIEGSWRGAASGTPRASERATSLLESPVFPCHRSFGPLLILAAPVLLTATPARAVGQMVQPKGILINRTANTSGYTAGFTVTNNVGHTLNLSCTASGPVTCTGQSANTVPPGFSGGVNVTYNVSVAGSGTLALHASYLSFADSGYWRIEVKSVAVTPDGGTAATRTPNGQVYSETFTVQNIGGIIETYTFSCLGSAAVVCTGTTPTTVTLAPSQNQLVTSSYYTGSAGSGTLKLIALNAGQKGDTGSFSVPVVALGVSVAPDSGPTLARLANTGPYKEVFTIQNTGAATQTFAISCTGSSNVTCNGLNASSIQLSAGATTTDTATYSVGAAGTGTLAVTASAPGASEGGSYRIGVVSSTQQAPAVAVDAVNAGKLSERDLCFTIALGQAAASECGDLRIVHPLPTTRTMNKARTPTLLYNSQFARPYPVVAALVTLPSTVIPDSVEAVLKVGSDTVGKKRWGGSEWGAGATRRIALGFDGASRPTGIYSYTLEVASIYPSRLSATATGQLAIVNRQSSPFGTGWWLAGLEQLNVGTMTWVGGDGSVRQYQQVPGTTDKWVTDSVDHPDTLKRVGTAPNDNYVRYLPKGVEVWFDGRGRHVYTYNQQRHQTRFWQDSIKGVLDSISLPVVFANRVYRFSYTPSAPYRLTAVTAPDIGSTIRADTISQASGFITRIKDADGKYVQFTPHATVPELIASRIDRRNTPVTFAYDTLGGRKVAGSTLNPGTPAAPIVLKITPQQSLGLKQSVDPTNAYTLIDGPRTDSADITKIWQDRWGQPALIQDAHGFLTRVLRGDARWPGLATEVVRASGWRFTASYDARGNPASTTDYGFGGYPTTTYVWDQKCDAPTKIKRAEGDSVVMTYDQVTCNRAWQQDGRGDSTRVRFVYNSANQVIKIIRPGMTPAESISYDLSRGDVSSITTPKGFVTQFVRDQVGRLTWLATRVDTVLTNVPVYQSTVTNYDLLDRDTLQMTIGPPLGDAPAETVYVRKFYNANGQTDTLWRWSSPDVVTDIDTIRTRWRYDLAGRAVAEIAPDDSLSNPRVDSTFYDPGGNVDSVRTRRGHKIRMVYDALNRLVRRSLPQVDYPSRPVSVDCSNLACGPAHPAYSIPAETHTFAYDALGHLLTADNADAKVKRTYFPNGLLDTDSLWIQTVGRDDWSKHRYGSRLMYDRDGHRVSVYLPTQLAGGVSSLISFAYERQLGALQTVIDPQANRYDFTYNARGERRSIAYPGNYAETFRYDFDGRLIADTIRNFGGIAAPRIPVDPVRATQYAYDGQGRILWSGDRMNYKDTLWTSYSGLGHLRHSRFSEWGQFAGGCAWGRSWSHEDFGDDAMANRSVSYRLDSLAAGCLDPGAVGGVVTASYYWRGTGRQLTDSLQVILTGHKSVTNRSYDASGNLDFTSTVSAFNTQDERASFFAADGGLRAVDYRWISANESWEKYSFEDYRYDALGRRVWVRARKWCYDTAMDYAHATDCRTSTLRRTIWDGDQELGEIQMPWGLNQLNPNTPQDSITTTPTWWENDAVPGAIGTVSMDRGLGDPNPHFGTVIYTAGQGIDQPLAITRVGYVMQLDAYHRNSFNRTQPPFTIVPFWQATGDARIGIFANGAQTLCDPPPSDFKCVALGWPGWWSTYNRDEAEAASRLSWHGTLLESRRDKSGLSYMRNRYYDPATGRFTQEDPIGLAGGLNLYGFAGGDPVNFSDPFGLCKVQDKIAGNCTQSDVGASEVPAATQWDKSQDEPLIDESWNTFAAATIAYSAAGLARSAGGATVTFFRGVGAAEAKQIAADGVLKTVAHGAEGKYLTNTAEAAGKWAERLHGPGGRVVQVTVPQAAAKGMQYLGRVDAIGDAWFATMQQLRDATVVILR